MMPPDPHPVSVSPPRRPSALSDPAIRAKGQAPAKATHRARKLRGLIETSPPLTEAQIAELRALLDKHPRLGD